MMSDNLRGILAVLTTLHRERASLKRAAVPAAAE